MNKKTEMTVTVTAREISEMMRHIGSLGGRARARNLSKERLSEIGRMGWAVRKANSETAETD